jgi:hypothetical protein
MQDVLLIIETLLADFEWYEIPVTPATRAAACKLVVEYNLGGQDAIHLACAAEEGVDNIASLDKDFRRVNGLVLWNDQIYGQRRRKVRPRLISRPETHQSAAVPLAMDQG